MKHTTTCFDYSIFRDDKEISFEATVELVNGGIGQYEFGGQRHYDNSPECEIANIKGLPDEIELTENEKSDLIIEGSERIRDKNLDYSDSDDR